MKTRALRIFGLSMINIITSRNCPEGQMRFPGPISPGSPFRGCGTASSFHNHTHEHVWRTRFLGQWGVKVRDTSKEREMGEGGKKVLRWSGRPPPSRMLGFEEILSLLLNKRSCTETWRELTWVSHFLALPPQSLFLPWPCPLRFSAVHQEDA